MGDRFRPGDLVRLKLGGPPMTVLGYRDYALARLCHCRWFDDRNQEVEEYFTDEELLAYEDRG